jgi:hypothetical protein
MVQVSFLASDNQDAWPRRKIYSDTIRGPEIHPRVWILNPTNHPSMVLRTKLPNLATVTYSLSFLHNLNMVLESASSPLVDFGELNDNTIKGLTSLLSVEKEIIAYT